MNAHTFYRTKSRKEILRVCEMAGTKLSYFRLLALGFSRCSVDMAHQLELASGGEMSLRELLPHSKTMERLRANIKVKADLTGNGST